MSLINNMLKGLERRRLDERGSAYDPVLGELSAVEYEELTSRKSANSSGLWIVIALALLALILYFSGPFWSITPGPVPKTVQFDRNTGDTSDNYTPENPVAEGQESVAQIPVPERSAGTESDGFSLKLAPVLMASAEDTIQMIKSGPEPVSLDNIQIAREGEALKLNVVMPVKVKYLMYTLAEPHRVVLELSNAAYDGALPDIRTLEGVSAIRQRIENDGTYKLVLESDREILIDETELANRDGGYALQVNMIRVQDEASRVVSSIAPESGTAGTFNKSPAKGTDRSGRDEIAKTASRADVLVHEGRKLYEEGEVRKGIEKIIEAVKLEPEHVSARINLAVLLVEQDREEAARKVLADGLHIRPGQPEWARVLARMLYSNGALEQAKTILEGAAPPISTNLEYHALYAGVLQALDEHTRAAIVYRSLLKYGGNNGSWWLGLAISLEAMARNSDAIVAYRNALDTPGIKPDSARFIKDRLQNLNQQS